MSTVSLEIDFITACNYSPANREPRIRNSALTSRAWRELPTLTNRFTFDEREGGGGGRGEEKKKKRKETTTRRKRTDPIENFRLVRDRVGQVERQQILENTVEKTNVAGEPGRMGE